MFKSAFSRTTLVRAALLISVGWLLQAQTQTPVRITPAESGSASAKSEAKADSSRVVLTEKKSVSIRIGIVQPAVHLGEPAAGENIADALQKLIAQYLRGPSLELISIAAMSPLNVDEEARQKACDYVLFSTLTQKASTSRFGMLKKAAPFAAMIPGVGAVAGIGGVIAGTAASTAELGSLVKAKTEEVFEYRLMTPLSNPPVLANSLKAKAKNDGEDIITPLVTQADAAILANLSGKK